MRPKQIVRFLDYPVLKQNKR